MGLALSIALGIILAFILWPFILTIFQIIFFGGIGAGVATSEKTGNPLLGIIVSVGIFGIVIWGIVACVG